VRPAVRVRLVVRGQRLGDLLQPFLQLRRRPRVERGHRADDAGLHCSITSFGLLMMNSGEPITGSSRFWRARGSLDMVLAILKENSTVVLVTYLVIRLDTVSWWRSERPWIAGSSPQ
jgi:hypothetical protein